MPPHIHTIELHLLKKSYHFSRLQATHKKFAPALLLETAYLDPALHFI